MASGAARPGGTATHASRSTARPWTILVGSGFLTGISHRTERARCCIRPPPSDHDVRTARLVAGRDYGLRERRRSCEFEAASRRFSGAAARSDGGVVVSHG
jgi:hypothetical protein